MAAGTMNSATPTPAVRSTRPVSSSCSTSDTIPATMLKMPKNIASWSVSGMCALAIALNCQPATVVAAPTVRSATAIARRYGDSRTSARLRRKPAVVVGAGRRRVVADVAGRSRQIITTSAAHAIKRQRDP